MELRWGTELNSESVNRLGDYPDGYEAARIANLLHFASLTPGQRVEWLAHALEIYQAIQIERAALLSEPPVNSQQ